MRRRTLRRFHRRSRNKAAGAVAPQQIGVADDEHGMKAGGAVKSGFRVHVLRGDQQERSLRRIMPRRLTQGARSLNRRLGQRHRLPRQPGGSETPIGVARDIV